MAGIENLVPLTTEKAREIGRLGGIASGERKRAVKSMREVYLRFLAKTISVDIDTDEGPRKKKRVAMTGAELLEYSMNKALARGTVSAFRMAKELREGLDGKAKSPRKRLDINKLLK